MLDPSLIIEQALLVNCYLHVALSLKNGNGLDNIKNLDLSFLPLMRQNHQKRSEENTIRV